MTWTTSTIHTRSTIGSSSPSSPPPSSQDHHPVPSHHNTAPCISSGQAGGVEIGDGAGLDLEGLSLDVVAAELLVGLADGDGLVALAVDMDGLGMLLPGRQLQDLQLWEGPVWRRRRWYVKGLGGSVVGLQVLHGLLAQGDDVHLLGPTVAGLDLTFQHADGLDVLALVHQSEVLDMAR